MKLKPNQILIDVEKDSIYVTDFRKGQGFKKISVLNTYLSNLIKYKYSELGKDREYIPEFAVGSLVTLKNNPGSTVFIVRRNVDFYSVVEKVDRGSLEKSVDMTFFVQRVSLVEHKDTNFNKLDHYHMHYDSPETCEKCKEQKDV